ncbi:MAG: iron export ABC transporter permease subunit FetB [Actinomycetota bacterium]|nr:iron export ABC transporter permease subunit FetB [Actinomycetota bacterium]
MTDIAISLILVAVGVGISWRYRLGLEKDFVIASVRAILQLGAVALVVAFVFEHAALSAAFVVVMLGVAAFTSARRLRGVPNAGAIATGAIAAGAFATLVVLFGSRALELQPRYIIPIAGMAIGNCMATVSVAGVRVREEIADKNLEVEARLALGVPARTALEPYVRRAARVALIPIVDTTKTVGLVTLPGAFTGMLLGGATPLDAARVQLIVLFMLMGSIAIAGMATAMLVTRAFVADGERIVVPASS